MELFTGSLQRAQVILAPHVLVPFPEHVERVAQDFITFEFRLCPIGCRLFDLERLAIFQVLAQSIYGLAEDPIAFALCYLERPDLVDDVVDYIAQVHGIQHAETEINSEFQPWLSGLSFDSIAVFEQQDSKAVEARILQSRANLGLIHAKAARAAKTSREEDVVVQNLLARHAFFFEELQVLDEIANRKISRITLTVVAEILASLESRNVRHRK